MTDQTYNGWTNRETWLVNLWLNNDEGIQRDAQAACNHDGEMLQEVATSLEIFVDELLTDGWVEAGTRGFQMDLMNAALARVNWAEIAGHFREG